MRELTPLEKLTLDLMMIPVRAGGEIVKSEWRRNRERQRRNLDLPPLLEPNEESK